MVINNTISWFRGLNVLPIKLNFRMWWGHWSPLLQNINKIDVTGQLMWYSWTDDGLSGGGGDKHHITHWVFKIHAEYTFCDISNGSTDALTILYHCPFLLGRTFFISICKHYSWMVLSLMAATTHSFHVQVCKSYLDGVRQLMSAPQIQPSFPSSPRTPSAAAGIFGGHDKILGL